MPLFFRSTGVVVPIVGISVTHGITVGGAAATPDDYYFVPRAAPPAAPAFFSSTPVDTTFAYLSAGSTQTVDLFVRYQHSIIR